MYHFIEKLHTLYGLLRDEQSKEIFQARFAIDMEPSIPNIKRLVSLRGYKDQSVFGWTQPQIEVLKKLNQEHKEIVLYGTAQTARLTAKLLKFEHIDFYGFCGRGAKEFPNGLLGKPVLSPDELVSSGKYYVVPAVGTVSYPEIIQFLQKYNYPKEYILDWVDVHCFDEKQYFEFPALYRQGTAFIDGGCYDCEDSYKFAEWCGGAYSSIIAFEPDPDNYAKCLKRMQDAPLRNFQLVNAGLSSREGTAIFDARNTMESQIIADESSTAFDCYQARIKNRIPVRTVIIDDIVGGNTVGFIKMDIEGAEFDALHGAKSTICRGICLPLWIICISCSRNTAFCYVITRYQWVIPYSMRPLICNAAMLLV